MSPAVTMVSLTAAAIDALAADDRESAEREAGRHLPAGVLENASLWRRRSAQLRETPSDLPWVSRLLLDDSGAVVGHAGFHAGPDEAGMVEVGYSIEPPERGRGLAKAALAELLREARAAPDVHVLRATVSPDNAASLSIVRAAGLVEDGEQWDEEDGLELIFETPV